MFPSPYLGLELRREVQRILTDCATQLEALLNQLPVDRPETWRALLDALLAQWERIGIKITAASRESLYALLEQAKAAQAPVAVGMAFRPQVRGFWPFDNLAVPIEQLKRAWELAAGLKGALLDGNPDRLLAEMRRIVDDLPKLVPPAVNLFEFGREAVAEAQSMLRNLIEFAEALPPEAKALIPDLFQIFLDMVGLVPAFGEPIDVISGVISVYNGEYWQAALTILTVIPVVGIFAGISKILRRLDKLREAVGRLKGPAGKILLELIEFLAERLKRISVTGGALGKQLKELYDAAKKKLRELTEKLRKAKEPPEAPKSKAPEKPKAREPETPKTPEQPQSPDGPEQRPKPDEPDTKSKSDEPSPHVKPDDGIDVSEVLDFKMRPGMAVRERNGTKIYGTAQVTKSKGVETLHAKTVDRVADKMADSGEYERIFVNRSYRTATDTKVSKRRRDVIGVRKDGKVDVVEVVSKNDQPKLLEKRMEEGLETLPKERRGKSRTVNMPAEPQ